MSFSLIKRILIGPPLKTAELAQQKIGNFKALAIFSSDALSSVAYGTEEILWVLVAALAFNLTLPILLAIVCLLALLTISYRQTIYEYPNGGGSFIVAKENLGLYPGLIAAASLTTDYVLTVAVSVSAGIAAITSAYPQLLPFKVELCLLSICLIMLVNLRGIQASGTIFAIPTYAFLFSTLLLIVMGLLKIHQGNFELAPSHLPMHPAVDSVTILLVLRAFSAGCTSLTGVEAISNGVPAFRSPESHNAAKTMVWMAIALGIMSLGMGFLASAIHIVPHHDETVMSQIAGIVFGKNSLFYILHQWFTMLILILAANTSFAGFPRLGYILAKSGFVPRSMAMKGDRLVYSNGIIILAAIAGLLIIIFHGTQHFLMPLYAIGVFLSFTLSQGGMVMHWVRLRKEKKVLVPLLINGIGALATGIVLVVLAWTKFTHGAWVVLLIIPFFVMLFKSINEHYAAVRAELKVGKHVEIIPQEKQHLIVLAIGGTTKVARDTVDYILTLVNNHTMIRAVHVNVHKEGHEKTIERIREFSTWVENKIPLDVLESPYRSILEPLENYMLELRRNYPDYTITMAIPEFLTSNKLANFLLHGDTGRLIYNHFTELEFNVIFVPYRIKTTSKTENKKCCQNNIEDAIMIKNK
ncbi:APC family permease [Bacillota bacterium LX-D]|nr:APC family permease [Bacillota bacterium LX-D]